MKKILRIARIAAILLAIALLLVGAYIEFRLQILRTSPQVDLSRIAAESSIVAVVRPELAIDQIESILSERVGFDVPRWIIRRALPFQAAFVTSSDYDDSEVDLTVFLNPRHFSQELQDRLNERGIQSISPRIQWAEAGIVADTAGVLQAHGAVAMETEAQEAAWYLWKQSFKPAPLPFRGQHFIEVVMDNRDGGAYLAVASLLHAFDIKLDKDQTDISLSSLKFVTESRMLVDITPEDVLVLRLSIEVRPDAVNRLGVINFKVGITELIVGWGEMLTTEYALPFEGESSWDENVMHFDYRVKGATKVMELAMEGKLFKKELHTRPAVKRVRQRNIVRKL